MASLRGKSGGGVQGVEPSSKQNVLRPALIGRESEISELTNALDHALIGNGRTVALVGEAGIGKTQLLSYVKREAESRNATAVSATCSSLPGSPPLWPWREIFSNLGSTLDISGAQSSAVDAEQNFELFANIVSSIREASSAKPLVICLDDFHWADSPSLDLISFAASQLASSAVLVVISLRTAETDSNPATRKMLNSLNRLEHFSRIEPQALSNLEVREMVESAINHTVSREVVREVTKKSHGVPLFVQELARLIDSRGQSLAGGLPDQIKEILGAHIDTLSEGAQLWLQTAAILGQSFRPTDVVEIISRSGLSTRDDQSLENDLDFADQAMSAGILTASLSHPGQIEFTHPLFSEVSRTRLGVGSSIKLHADAAELLEETYGQSAENHASELAWHFKEASTSLGFERFIHYSLIAGQSALRSFAWSEAIEHFENVRQVVESMPSRIELAHAWLGIARARLTWQNKYGSSLGPHEIEAVLAIAFDIFVEHGETNYAIQTASQGIVAEFSYVPAVSLSERALEFATEDSVQVTALWVRHADVLWHYDSRREESYSAFERAMEMAVKHNDVPLQLRILRIRTQFSRHHKQYDKTLTMRDQAVKLNRTTGSDMDLSRLHVHAAIAEASIGETKKSSISLDTANMISEELGIESNMYHLVCADLAIAQARFDDSLEHARELGRLEDGPVEAMFELLKRAYTGDLSEALEFGRARMAELPDNRAIQTFRAVYSLMLLWIGTDLQDEDAIAESTAVVQSLMGESTTDGFTTDMLARMKIKMVIGSGSESERQQGYEALLLERNTFAIGSVGPANDQMLAEFSLVLGNREQALMHFEESLDLCRKAGFVLTECKTALAYAETLIDQGSRTEVALAIKILNDSLKLAHEFKLKTLSEKFTALLEKNFSGTSG